MLVTSHRRSTTHTETRIDQSEALREARDALAGLRIRVRARTAHRNSLLRAAQGILTIHGRLAAMLDTRVRHLHWTPERHLAAVGLAAMKLQLEPILTAVPDLPLEQVRAHLDDALELGMNAAALLADDAP